MTELTIDPNVRVAGGLTFSGFEDVCGPMPSEGQSVLVREPQANLVAVGIVDRIDHVDSLIYLAVRWETLAPDRTAAEYAELLGQTGFRQTRVVPTGGPMSVVEALPV